MLHTIAAVASWIVVAFFIVWALIWGSLIGLFHWVWIRPCDDAACAGEVLGPMLYVAFWSWGAYVLLPAASLALPFLVGSHLTRRSDARVMRLALACFAAALLPLLVVFAEVWWFRSIGSE